MKMLSLFDGSGGFSLSGYLSGVDPIMASEVEPYPVAVTKSRFPEMKHLGDVSKVKGEEIEPVDIITFGSPCQDLSIAGKRAGLKHEENGDDETTRSGLFMEAIRIIKEMRGATNGKYPKYAVWENVPGAFSSNNKEDFRVVIEEFVKVVEPRATVPPIEGKGWPYADVYVGDGWSVGYRTFDAQYWGVPQRRRRIYLVASFTNERAGEILFKSEGLRGNFAESGTQRETATRNTEDGTGTAVHEGNELVLDDQGGSQINVRNDGKVPTLRAEAHGNLPCVTLKIRSGCAGGGKGALWQEDKSATLSTLNDQYLFQPTYAFEPGIASREGGHIYEDVSGTLRANPGDIAMSTAYSFDSLASNSMKSSNPNSGYREVDKAKTIDTSNGDPSKNQGGIAIVTVKNLNQGDVQSKAVLDPEGIAPALYAGECRGGGGECYVLQGSMIGREDKNGPQGDGVNEDVSFTLNTIDRHAVAYLASGKDKTGCLMASGYDKLGAQEMFSGDYTVIEEQPSEIYSLETFHCTTETDKTQPLKARDYKDPLVIGLDRASFNQGQNAKYDFTILEGLEPTLVARGPNAVCVMASSNVNAEMTDGSISPCLMARAGTGGNQLPLVTTENETVGALCASDYKGIRNQNTDQCVVEKQPQRYIVRRLTPTECCRLQGFPDFWGETDAKEDFTDDEYEFWKEVRTTDANIKGKQIKDWTKKQMLTWYNKLHTDSAEYKMWGNGIALPNALYVMQNIVEDYEKGE